MLTYKEQQILDKVHKVVRQKQIKYYDFIPFFNFQYEKIIFNCQPFHFSSCSVVPATGKVIRHFVNQLVLPGVAFGSKQAEVTKKKRVLLVIKKIRLL